MDTIYTIETIHDLNVHKEFSKGFVQASLPHNLMLILAGIISIFMIFSFDTPFYVYYYLVLVAVCLVLSLIRNRKGGDIQYKRMLQMNDGEPQHQIYSLTADGIRAVNPKNGNKLELRYDMFRSIIETPNLLILVMEHRSCLILEKRWLKGGTLQELTQFLLENCPKLKPRKVKTTTFGKWVRRVLILTISVTTLFALASLSGVSLLDRLTGKLHNEMSYQEMADELSTLGITISSRTIEELEAYDDEFYTENGMEFYDQYATESKVMDLLYWEGSGSYDEQTYDWIPSTSGVFCFDMEVLDVDTIYTDFLRGLSAMNTELAFTNVQEDYSNVDPDEGIGTVTVSFDFNGTSCTLDASFYYDWFDISFLSRVSSLIESDGNENNLYYSNDGQGLLLYYGSRDQVKQLERMTGISFSDTVSEFSWF